jgi:hypothetical protein
VLAIRQLPQQGGYLGDGAALERLHVGGRRGQPELVQEADQGLGPLERGDAQLGFQLDVVLDDLGRELHQLDEHAPHRVAQFGLRRQSTRVAGGGGAGGAVTKSTGVDAGAVGTEGAGMIGGDVTAALAVIGLAAWAVTFGIGRPAWPCVASAAD